MLVESRKPGAGRRQHGSSTLDASWECEDGIEFCIYFEPSGEARKYTLRLSEVEALNLSRDLAEFIELREKEDAKNDR